MGRRLSALGRRMRAQGTPRLWAVLIVSLTLHLVLGVHLLRTYPFIPFKPICYDDISLITLDNGPLYTLDGKMTWEFEDVLHYQLYYWDVPYRIASGGTILVTFADWFEENYLWNMTSKAIRKMIAKREGVPRSDEHTSELQSLMRISYAVLC